MRPLNHIFAYHIDSITLVDGNYELIPEPEGGYSEDPGTFIKEFCEAPNQGSEDNNLTDPAPPAKASPRHKPLFYLPHCNYIYLYMSIYTLCFQELL
jgi:hypothetical protein